MKNVVVIPLPEVVKQFTFFAFIVIVHLFFIGRNDFLAQVCFKTLLSYKLQ